MSPPSPQSSLFEQAGQRFDLDRLRSDLERTGKITPKNWEYLKGILCGLDQEEIAEQCFAAKGTVKTALTRGVKEQILELLLGKSEVDWKRLPAWLIEAGYGIGKNHHINWQQVCRGMLDHQKKLSTNEVIASKAMQFDLLDDEIFVSLALVERKEPDRLSQDVHPTRSLKRYEEKPPIEYEAFREQVLRQGESDRIAIIGEPGAGKTTLLQHIALWILEQRLGLPIWISLGDLIKSGELQRLKDYLTQVWLEDAIPNVTEEVKSVFLNQLNHQRVWLLLDGADEMVASSGIALREIHKQLGSWLSQSSIVLTCRINVWDADINALRDFQTYRTKEFCYPAQVEQFIKSGFRESNQPSGERLKTELAKTEHGRLQQLVRNPLRLMMLCTTWHEHKSLPATKAELYGRFINEFYKWNKTKWKKKDLNYAFFPNTKAKQEKLTQALGRLACRALDEEEAPFRLSHNLVFNELGDPEDDGSEFWLALNLGWLQIARNADKSSEKVYTFFHPTFQECFAAFSINDWDDFLPRDHQDKPTKNRKGKDTYRIFEQHWKEAFLLWLGRKEIELDLKEKLIQKLISFSSHSGKLYSYKAYFLAGAGISEFKSKFADTIVKNLIGWGVIETEIGFVGTGSRNTLRETDQETAIQALIEFFRETHFTDVKANILQHLTLINSSHRMITEFLAQPSQDIILAKCELERRKELWSDGLSREVEDWRSKEFHKRLSFLGLVSRNTATDNEETIYDLLLLLEEEENRLEPKKKLSEVLFTFNDFLYYQKKYSDECLYKMVVSLKKLLSKRYSGNYTDYLWRCAQNMSYPEFYRAWNSSSSTTDADFSTE
jgi:predicted NACHT family NTPase